MGVEANELDHLRDDDISVSLSHKPLDISATVSSVSSPKAGATVLFAGCHSSPPVVLKLMPIMTRRYYS